MAMFHFRIKSDKKPDGSKISAFKHVEYIRRGGNFAEVENWEEKNKFVGNFISSADVKDACDRLNFLLYKTDDFGSIRNSPNGIEVTEKFSPTTLAVALTLADKTMNHQPLIISGSPNFKQSVLQSALVFNLDISFADQLIQYEFFRRKEIIRNERNNFISNGGTLISKRHFLTKIFSPIHSRTIEEVTKAGLNLRTISALPALPQSENDITLSEEEKIELNQLAHDSYKNLRFDFSDERKNFAKWTADKILQRIHYSQSLLSAICKTFCKLYANPTTYKKTLSTPMMILFPALRIKFLLSLLPPLS